MATKTQQKIKEMYFNKISISHIAKTLSISRQYIYRVIKQQGYNKVTDVTSPHGFHGKYRYHAAHFIIHIISKGLRFKKATGTQGFVNGHRYIIYKNGTISLYQSAGNEYPASIYADDLDGLQSLVSEYWNMIFTRLERRLDVLLIKDGVPTFEEARSQIAYIDEQGFTQKVILEYGKGFYIYNKDGKAIMIFDMSHGKAEREYIAGHSNNTIHAKKVEPYINSIVYDQHYKPSEVKELLDKLHEVVYLREKDYAEWALNLKSHVGAIKTLSHKVAQLGHLYKDRPKDKTEHKQKTMKGWI